MRGHLSSVLLMSIALGCGGGSAPSDEASRARSGSVTDPSLHACSPLHGDTAPIALERVLAVGRHTDGTLYVIDRGRPEYRSFVSEGGVLQRKAVAGSGESGNSVVVTVRDPDAPYALKVELSGETATKMGVYRGELDAKDFEIGQRGDLLEVVGIDAVKSLPVRNLPAGVVVDFDAKTNEGQRVVVLRPEVDFEYEDYRIFFGTPARMVERPLVRAIGGGRTYLTFMIDGVETTAVFPNAGDVRPPELRRGARTETLTMVGGSVGGGSAAAGKSDAPLTFLCL